MWLKHLRSVVVDPRNFGRWNSFRSSIKQSVDLQVWKVCFLPLLCIPYRSNIIMSRTGHRSKTPVLKVLKPYPAITHPLLQFVYSAFHFGVFLD